LILAVLLAAVPKVPAQLKPPVPATTPEAPKTEPPQDTLGRTTPRGAVLSFLAAARKENDQVAALYLNTPLRGEAAQQLAHKLAIVLDRKLPARLNQLSDEPEGAVPDPLKPDEDVVGTITTEKGDLNITLERVDRGKVGKVWLFSRQTLDSIPAVYQEVNTPAVERFLPEFLVKTRIAEIPLFEYLAVFIGLPLLYLFTGLLSRALGLIVRVVRRGVLRQPTDQRVSPLPQPVRLFLMAGIIYSLLSRVGLPLLARQFWLIVVLVIMIVASTWLLLLLNSRIERLLLRRLRRRNLTGATSVLRLSRRVVDILILFAAFLFCLRHFGVDPTAALAGLGVGGIAVALAAQKTLENVIGGASLIADQAVRVGDTLKLGDVVGTVEDVGLRSTRIRTMDRTVVTVPNGQIATVSLETFSARDKFWFRHMVGLRYDTSAEQMRVVIDNIRALLETHPNTERDSTRVRLIRLGPSSLDIELIAYVVAADWNQFLQIQEALLLAILGIVAAAGTKIALPSQTMYLSDDLSSSTRKAKAISPPTAEKSMDTGAQAKSA
jgi:MscS family membrane protein